MKSRIKYGFISMLLAVFAAQPVLASPLNNDDMEFAFGASSAAYSDLGEMALLSDQEMKETEGEWWFLPVIGYTAFGAGLGAYHSYRTTGGFNWRDIGAGATAGFYASPMGRPFGTVGRFAMGSLGSYSWYW